MIQTIWLRTWPVTSRDSRTMFGILWTDSPSVSRSLEWQKKNLLYEVIKAFANVDLSPERVDNHQMGYVFEELIRIGAEQSNEEAGEHFTPREVIRLMVNLLLAPEKDLAKTGVVKTIFDPACGTGGMLSITEEYIRSLNAKASLHLFGQDWNDEAWAICRSDMLIKGENADNIVLGDSFEKAVSPSLNTSLTTCSPIPLSVWSGNSSRNSSRRKLREVIKDVSEQACRGSMMGRSCSFST
jgi:N-6 DNA Methylase